MIENNFDICGTLTIFFMLMEFFGILCGYTHHHFSLRVTVFTTGLSELGPEVIKVFVLPKLKALSDKIEQCMEGMNAYDKNAATHIKGLLLVSGKMILYYTRLNIEIHTEIRWKNDIKVVKE